MINIIKNYKWVIATSSICVFFGLLTFFTFINQSFIELNEGNLQTLLFIDAVLLILFFTLVIRETYKIFKQRKEEKIGSKTSLRYIILFSSTTLLPSIIIAIFSLVLFDVGIQKFFDKKIKLVVNNSTEVAKNYVEQVKNSIQADVLLMDIDINRNANIYKDNLK